MRTIFFQFLPFPLFHFSSARGIVPYSSKSRATIFQEVRDVKTCRSTRIPATFTSVALIGWCYIVEDLAAKKVSVKGKCCRPGRGKYWHMFYGYKYWRSLVSATERIVESGIAAPPLLSLFSFIFYEISYILEILIENIQERFQENPIV